MNCLIAYILKTLDNKNESKVASGFPRRQDFDITRGWSAQPRTPLVIPIHNTIV